MAELVAGAFLSSSFQVIFEKLASVDIRDYFGGNKLDDLVKELDIKLNSINHVLEEAEIKQYQNTYVKTWLDELKHVLYEADQILDEIATDAMLKQMKAESEPVTTSVLNLFSALTTNPFEIGINKLLEKLELLATQTKRLGLEDGPSASKEGLVSWKPAKTLSTASLVDESTIYVRDVRKQELINILLEGNDSGNQVPSIISIVGLGGMGKTTLAKLVYNDNKIKEHFQLEAWVYVSESFDDVGLTKAILESFKFSANGENLNLLQSHLQHELTGKKYLLVLDDIWNWNGNAACWENLLLPFNHGSSGSKIIVTTRDKGVQNVLNSKLFDLQQLDQSDCWRLFETHAFHGRNVCEHSDLKLIGEKIVKKCGGLPLAVETMGKLLKRKFSEPDWMKILETRLSYEDNKVNPVLRLSYHNLPSNHKRCFAYCSIFPKGDKIDKGALINLWMAEGLLKCSGAEKSEVELGNEIFSDLESISFFQKSFFHEYVMHDLVNDLAKSVSGEFCMQIEGSRVEGIPERTRHILLTSLQYLDCGDKLLEPICKCNGLRSLILIPEGVCMISNNVQRDLFSRLTYLRMLSFRCCDLSEIVDEIGNLKLLRYLDLSYTEITSLPDTICMLYNLQTLLLEKCDKLTELPSNFSKLINLRSLELPDLKKMPKNIGKLKNLQTLNYFIVEEHNGSGIKELANMNNLHGTIKITGLGNVIDLADAAMANLKDKKYLEELYMVFDGRREEMNASVLEALQPNCNLKKLTIQNYNGNCFPKWLRDLPNLVSLKLKNCELFSELPPLGQLRCLKELSISHCDGIKTIGEDFYDNNNSTSLVPFRSLEFLEFEKMDNWEEWLCLEGFPMLKVLYIRECPELKRFPPQQLPSLQKLKITDCKMLEASIPKGDNMEELILERCDRISVNELPTNLKRFVLWENRYTEFAEEQNLVNCTILEKLRFDLRGFVGKRPSLDLRCYNSLRRLKINGCDSSSSLPFSLHLFTNLQYLFLYDFPQLESFPRGGLPSNLIFLLIENCPQLESFPKGGLPSNLSWLVIYNCPKVIGSREEWGLFQLNSLKGLRVSGYEFENVESFPEENLLPPTLKELVLRNCSKLRIMNNKGFLHLNSLKYLSIGSCPGLESLPEEGLQQLSSLSQLEIIDCPIIREKYKKEGGERWHTISHIPYVWIDEIEQ